MSPGRFLKILLSSLLVIVVLAVVKFEYSANEYSSSIQDYESFQQAAKSIIDIAVSMGSAVWNWLRDLNHEDWLVISTVLIAIFTGSLWWSTRRLWKAGGKQLRITQRSHIAVEPQGILPLSVDADTIGRISIKNVGNCPAKNVRWYVNQDISKNLREEVFSIKENELGQSNVVPPGIAMYFSQNINILPVGISAVEREGAAYYVWGIVRYTDVFGGDRYTKFCHRYGADCLFNITKGTHKGKVGLSRKKAKYHQWGNETDEVE